MRAIAVGRLLRMTRIRRGLRQEDVARRASLSAATVGRHENGTMSSLAALERHTSALSLRVELRVVGRAGELTRLTDEEHAAIAESLAAWFRSKGFVTEPEASFSEWGERGRIDLLAYQPGPGTLVVVEVKTQLLDLQDLFGALNVKERLAMTVAGQRRWQVRKSVVLLAVASTAANRRIVRLHPTLFDDFRRERLSAAALQGGHRRLLHWVRPPRGVGRWTAGRRRVRRPAVSGPTRARRRSGVSAGAT